MAVLACVMPPFEIWCIHFRTSTSLTEWYVRRCLSLLVAPTTILLFAVSTSPGSRLILRMPRYLSDIRALVGGYIKKFTVAYICGWAA